MNASQNYQGLYGYPLGATDLKVVRRKPGNEARVHDFMPAAHWPADKHKLLIFYPESFTPVCESELHELPDWVEAFAELDIFVAAACVDAPERIAEWLNTEEKLLKADYPIFSSRQLPEQLQVLLQTGRSKRASVFLMSNGEVIRQEHFFKVSRSLAELHRMAWGFVKGEKHAETCRPPTNTKKRGAK